MTTKTVIQMGTDGKIMMEIPTTKLEVISEYLDNLKESGFINMVTAAPCIKATFGLTKPESMLVLLHWMHKNVTK